MCTCRGKCARCCEGLFDVARHDEGNSDSHLEGMLTGNSVTVLIEAGKLVLERWQGIYFCEFDGSRKRDLIIKLLGFGPRDE